MFSLVATVPKARKSLFNIGSQFFTIMSKVFEVHEVVPDVIDTVPSEILNVSYSNGVSVKVGNKLTPTQVKDQPIVEWDADNKAYYTLCMTDPDAPSREQPKFREWHHWLVTNIPGKDISKGNVLSDYIGSGPPPDTGYHRYIFLVYKQPGKLDFTEKILTSHSAEGRNNFSIKKFAKKYNLGNPIAGNLFQAAYDDYVPKLYKQLEG